MDERYTLISNDYLLPEDSQFGFLPSAEGIIIRNQPLMNLMVDSSQPN